MKNVILPLFLGLAFSACAPATPQARIARNPERFAALDRKTQDLVKQGQIGPGMSPDAVVLAWGPPAQRFEGSKNTQITERWDYVSNMPVYTPTVGIYGAYGYGYGPYGRLGYPGYGYALSPEINFIPYRAASVWFIGNRVDAWERVR